MQRSLVRPLLVALFTALTPALTPVLTHAQDAPPARRGVVITDTARARALFVSKDPADLAGCGANCDRDIKARMATDSAYEARAKGVEIGRAHV